MSMFNRDALFGKKDEPPRNERRASVNVTPGLGGGSLPVRPQPPASDKPDLRFAEMQKPAPQPQTRQDETSGSRLIVGPDIKLKGVEITDCDTLEVEGRVEASMDSRLMIIKQHGVFSGKVSIDVAEIHGRFEGELTVRKQLNIYSTGRVTGTIRYGKVRIDEGGELAGEVSTLARAPAAAIAPTVSTQTTPSPAPSAVSTPAAGNAPPAPAAVPAAAAPASTGYTPSPPPLVLSRSAPPAPSVVAEETAASAAAAAKREPASSRSSTKPGRPNSTGLSI